MEVSFCALTQRSWSCAIKMAMRESMVAICFLTLLRRLRLKLRSSAQDNCAKRFCSALSNRLKCRRCASSSRKRAICSDCAALGGGCMALPKCTRTAASIWSVLAKTPAARATVARG